jgi:hypothetical protein
MILSLVLTKPETLRDMYFQQRLRLQRVSQQQKSQTPNKQQLMKRSSGQTNSVKRPRNLCQPASTMTTTPKSTVASTMGSDLFSEDRTQNGELFLLLQSWDIEVKIIRIIKLLVTTAAPRLIGSLETYSVIVINGLMGSVML